ncbi:MAG: germination protein YpeB [Clostridia bacterium]|nr:germination protein YpeB [Clostridia bacterium]
MLRKKHYQALLGVLAVALAVTAGIAVHAIQAKEQVSARLNEVYQGAVLSALRQMEDIDLALSKALLSGDQAAVDRYLTQVSAGAAQVQRSLSLLPLAHPAGKNAVKFSNQVADYAAALLGGAITARDAAQLETLIAACREYAAALYQAKDSLPERSAENVGFYATDTAGDNGSYDSGVSYPTLIYDGPFSDARDTGEAKALGGRMVTKEEAMALARAFVGEDRVLSAAPGADMGGSIPCWGVTLQLKDMTLQAAVTQQGGKVLWMAADTAAFPTEKSLEECRENALLFLQRNGFEQMQATYFQVYEGVAVISFAATQGDTLLYPDLIKVQLRMDTAQVVGIEARNYWQNHGPRGLLTPALSLEEAAGGVSAMLKVDQARLCLIPTDAGEKLCYEFQGVYGGHTYLCYINAHDGRQEQLLKVIEDETGIEAV